MTLEDKIKEYLDNSMPEVFFTNRIKVITLAHDIAEIAENYTTEKLLQATKIQSEIMIEIREENAELKAKLLDEMPGKIADICKNKDNLIKELQAKLDNVKYLDRDKVSKIFNKLVTAKMLSTLLALKSNPEQWHNVTDYENCINAICSLALPVIDKERVIK